MCLDMCEWMYECSQSVWWCQLSHCTFCDMKNHGKCGETQRDFRIKDSQMNEEENGMGSKWGREIKKAWWQIIVFLGKACKQSTKSCVEWDQSWNDFHSTRSLDEFSYNYYREQRERFTLQWRNFSSCSQSTTVENFQFFALSILPSWTEIRFSFVCARWRMKISDELWIFVRSIIIHF
mgnify:CR=1 FL=1